MSGVRETTRFQRRPCSTNWSVKDAGIHQNRMKRILSCILISVESSGFLTLTLLAPLDAQTFSIVIIELSMILAL